MEHKKSICLSMIVRNESKVIQRCLLSLKGIIDSWVVVDTGSTDGTQQIVKEVLSEIPGELHERPWVNFAQNRTEAFRLARPKADFTLLIDADEELLFSPDFCRPDFKDDVYIANVHYGPSFFHRELFINNQLNWYWEGVLHEQITCSEMKHRKIKIHYIKGVLNRSHPDGARNIDSKAKYRNDALILEEGLKKEPNNSRYMFYLGQSYSQCDEPERAIKAYEKRAEMGGWQEEIYHCLYMIPGLQEKLSADPFTILSNYAKAHRYRPIRAEPLFRIAFLHMKHGQPDLAYAVVRYARTIAAPPAEESMFVERDVYHYGFELLQMDAAQLMGKKEEAVELGETLLQKKGLPEQLAKSIRENVGRLRTNRLKSVVSSLAYKTPIGYV